MNEYFPKPKSLGANVKVELDLSNYTTKRDLKNAAVVDTSSFAKINLMSDVDQLDVDKLKNVPVDLSELNDLVKNDVVKKTEYNR